MCVCVLQERRILLSSEVFLPFFPVKLDVVDVDEAVVSLGKGWFSGGGFRGGACRVENET